MDVSLIPTGLYYYRARQYDPVLGRVFSHEVIQQRDQRRTLARSWTRKDASVVVMIVSENRGFIPTRWSIRHLSLLQPDPAKYQTLSAIIPCIPQYSLLLR